MELHTADILARASFVILTGLLAAALFFTMAAIREIRQHCLDGLLYLAMAVFFGAAHFYLLSNYVGPSYAERIAAGPDFWSWLITMAAPAVAFLFLAFGVCDALAARYHWALYKAFFGLTLVYYVYSLGAGWPIDVRGILTLIWCGVWFNLELKTAT